MPRRSEAGCSRVPAAPGHMVVIGHRQGQRHWPSHRVTRATSPSQGTRSAHGGPLTGAATVLVSVTHHPLAPAHTAGLLPCCTRGPRASQGWGVVQSEPWPGCRAERTYLRMYRKLNFDSGDLSQIT